MTPELAGLFEQTRGMAPAISVEFLNTLHDATETEIVHMKEAIDRLTEANQLLAEKLKSRAASRFGQKSENKAQPTSADASADNDDTSEKEESPTRLHKTSRPKPPRVYECEKSKPFPADLEHVVVDIWPPEQECQCGGALGNCGKPKITEIRCRRPAQYFVLRERHFNLRPHDRGVS